MADTTSTLTVGSGEKTRVSTVPTTILSPAHALVLAHYRAFLDRQDLQEQIFCRACWEGGAGPEPAKIARGANQLAVMCPHHVWFYQGALPPEVLESDAALGGLGDEPPARSQQIVLTDADASFVRLSVDDAKLLRAYREILLAYRWIETLDCRTCWSNGQPSGCRAFVTQQRVAIICRHRTLQFVGETA